MKTPESGKVRIQLLNGECTDWHEVDDIEITAHGANLARDDTPQGEPKIMALFVPWIFVRHLEYCTLDEYQKLKAKEKKP